MSGGAEAVLLIGDMYAEAAEAYLAGSVRCIKVDDPGRVTDEMASEAVAIIVRYPLPITTDLLGRCHRLRWVFASGSGTDNISVADCRRAGVKVVRNHGVNAASVAEHTMALLLALARRLKPAGPEEFWTHRLGAERVELAGKRLGLLGYGAVGREVARRAHAGFDMEVVACDVIPVEEGRQWLRHVVDGEELAATSDAVSLHVPLNETTRGLVDARFLSLMKPSAFLINTSRGQVVDEAALVRSLQRHVIAGAALDVFCEEPLPPRSALWAAPNLLLTPHVADATAECRQAMAMAAAHRCLEAMKRNGSDDDGGR
jgi:phosphoglycerate dehydrogenase-like enzyme